MDYQTKTKELLGSFRTVIDGDLLESLESMKLFGNETRSDSREQFVRGNPDVPGQDDHWLTLSVYRPTELIEGTPCLVRTLKKSRRGAWLYKIVIAPNAYKLEQEPLVDIAPEDFWQEAYWQYVGTAQPVNA